MSGTRAPKAQAMMGGGGPARAEQRQPPGGTSTAAAGSLTSTSLGVPSTAGSQRRRPNARWAAVGEASEASRDADVTVAHAHAQRHGCLSARWAQTCAPRAKGTTHPKSSVPKVRNRDYHLNVFTGVPNGTSAVRAEDLSVHAPPPPTSQAACTEKSSAQTVRGPRGLHSRSLVPPADDAPPR